MVSFDCPFCKNKLEAPAEALNRRIQCGNCENKFTFEEKHFSPEKSEQKISKSARPAKAPKKQKNPMPIILVLILIAGGTITFLNLPDKTGDENLAASVEVNSEDECDSERSSKNHH